MFLDKIVVSKKQEVAKLKKTFSLEQAEKDIAKLSPCRGFERALTEGRHRGMGLIAEVKKASPSKGLIRSDFQPKALAQQYEAAGADCLSVLTDQPFFQGCNAYLQEVREAVSIPLLRKDFMIDPAQIYEARIIGADAILLIAAILEKEQLKQMLGLAQDLGLDALVEVHDAAELETALAVDAKLIGVNNRNLHTFVTDLKTTDQLISQIPDNKTIVSESGISEPEQIRHFIEAGVSAVLIGEHFMRQPDVERAVQDLMGPVS